MLTQLDLINAMLRTIGTGGLTSADTSHPDYMEALAVLELELAAIQRLGLWFNTTTPTLKPNTSDEILLPNGTLHCDPVDTRLNYVKRGRKLFDMDCRKFTFDAPVKVKLITKLVLDELPETAKDYLRHSARYAFYLDNDGDERKLARLDAARNQSWAELWREHLRNRDVNRMHSPGVQRMAVGRYGNYARELRVRGHFR